ncbi:MAG: hypothetical protein WD850_01165 [Candidatus Spechtbacterales bacterium]
MSTQEEARVLDGVVGNYAGLWVPLEKNPESIPLGEMERRVGEATAPGFDFNGVPREQFAAWLLEFYKDNGALDLTDIDQQPTKGGRILIGMWQATKGELVQKPRARFVAFVTAAGVAWEVAALPA